MLMVLQIMVLLKLDSIGGIIFLVLFENLVTKIDLGLWQHMIFELFGANVGFPLQLLFGPLFLYTNMFKGNLVCQKVHRIVKYLKLKWMNPSIELKELV